MAYSDEDSILDQIYEKQIFWPSFMRFKILGVNYENAYLKKYSNLKQGTHKIGF